MIAAMLHDGHGLRDVIQITQGGLDLAKFDAVTTHLRLVVHAWNCRSSAAVDEPGRPCDRPELPRAEMSVNQEPFGQATGGGDNRRRRGRRYTTRLVVPPRLAADAHSGRTSLYREADGQWESVLEYAS